MNIEEYNYELPEELIAQVPLKVRDSSRLLVLDKETGEISHKSFHDIVSYFEEGDTIVLNDTKVIPARIIGEKEETHAVIELLLLKDIENDTWEALVKPARRVKTGTVVSFGNGLLKARCVEERSEGIRIFELEYEGILYEILDKLGTMPLPPYIHEKLEDQNRYQTVYAKNIGSAAAPTAGLHFTNELLESLKKKKVNIAYVTLHVGLGTFRPISCDNILDHHMHSEYYSIDSNCCDMIMASKKNGKKVVAVGTTVVRVLETVMNEKKALVPSSGWTDIFIYPGYEFKIVEHLITNFHLPKSTLLLLISALAGKEKVFKAYQEAIANKYRFFSFGDSMFITTKKVDKK